MAHLSWGFKDGTLQGGKCSEGCPHQQRGGDGERKRVSESGFVLKLLSTDHMEKLGSVISLNLREMVIPKSGGE